MTFAIGERDSIREERSWELSPIQSMLTGPEYPIPEDTVKTMGKEPVEHMMYGTARVETAAYSIQQWLSTATHRGSHAQSGLRS